MQVILSHESQLSVSSVELVSHCVSFVLGQTMSMAHLDVELAQIPDKVMDAVTIHKPFRRGPQYNRNALEHYYPMQDGLIKVVALPAGPIVSKDQPLAAGYGSYLPEAKPTLVARGNKRLSVGRVRSGRAFITMGNKDTGGVSATRYVSTHEMGHALGLVRREMSNHCGNICVMQARSEQYDKYNFLFEHGKPFCDPCQEYLESL